MWLKKKTASMLITPRVTLIDLEKHINFLMQLETRTTNDNRRAI